MKQATNFNHKDFISIGTPVNSKDYDLFKSIVDMGIDSHLEAFVKSKFFFDCGKFHFHFHKSEKSILLRRLNILIDETDNEGDADDIEYLEMWVNDIKEYNKLTA
jgi:hypothetical protein